VRLPPSPPRAKPNRPDHDASGATGRSAICAVAIAWVLGTPALGADTTASSPSGKTTSGPHHAVRAPARTESADDAKAAAADSRTASQRQRKLQSEQKDLQDRLARMKKNLADAEAAHSEATDALAESESAISAVQRRLHDLAAERSGVEHQLADVRTRQRAAASRQGDQERRLGALLQGLVAHEAAPESLGWLSTSLPLAAAGDGGALGGDAEIGLTGYLIADRARAIDALRDRRNELSDLEDEARERQDDLVGIAADERRNQKQLVREQETRRKTLAGLSRQIATQRTSVASLERDDKRLASLIQQLASVLAAPPRRPPRPAPDAAPGAVAAAPAAVEPPGGSGFALLRGKMRLPVAGEVSGRFGTARPGEDGEAQPGAPSWKGVFLRAPNGSEVHAVAAGRVVFADWLRGFGNLIIVDHGEGFISVYGNNETLLHSAGERITADEVIATVGNTGGNAESGLYFELRYEGRPFDPLAWATAR
jgi:murein hydrolase activator